MVAVLFARADSIYKTLPGLDVWDADRDARKWPGGAPVVAHPPCRAWGRLRMQAKPREDERELARFAVRAVRRWGGVLEHPSGSTLWPDMGLPMPGAGARDEWGGWTFAAPQKWWGHEAEKRTWFYIVGCPPMQIPPIPYVLGEAPKVIGITDPRGRPEILKAERERTPELLARWLVQLADSCRQWKRLDHA